MAGKRAKRQNKHTLLKLRELVIRGEWDNLYGHQLIAKVRPEYPSEEVKEIGPSRLHYSEVLDWKKLCARLLKDFVTNSTSLTMAIKPVLGHENWASVEKAAKGVELDRHSKWKIIRVVNRLLDLTQMLPFGLLVKDGKQMIMQHYQMHGTELRGPELRQLNRQILEMSFDGQFARSVHAVEFTTGLSDAEAEIEEQIADLIDEVAPILRAEIFFWAKLIGVHARLHEGLDLAARDADRRKLHRGVDKALEILNRTEQKLEEPFVLDEMSVLTQALSEARKRIRRPAPVSGPGRPPGPQFSPFTWMIQPDFRGRPTGGEIRLKRELVGQFLAAAFFEILREWNTSRTPRPRKPAEEARKVTADLLKRMGFGAADRWSPERIDKRRLQFFASSNHYAIRFRAALVLNYISIKPEDRAEVIALIQSLEPLTTPQVTRLSDLDSRSFGRPVSAFVERN